MKTKWKKQWTAIYMSLFMLFTAIPGSVLNVLAEEAVQVEYAQGNGVNEEAVYEAETVQEGDVPEDIAETGSDDSNEMLTKAEPTEEESAEEDPEEEEPAEEEPEEEESAEEDPTEEEPEEEDPIEEESAEEEPTEEEPTEEKPDEMLTETESAEEEADEMSMNTEPEANAQAEESPEDIDETEEASAVIDEEAVSRVGISYQLDSYIRSLEVIGDPDSAADSTVLTVKIGWLIDGAVHGAVDSFTYQLPVNFHIDHASTGQITRGTAGEEIGSYHVDTDGLVTITYDASYNTQGQTTINYMEITGQAKYGSDADGHQIRFDWSDESKVILIINPGDFKVEKTAVKKYADDVFSDRSYIVYTVVIESELGTNGAFTIDDALTLKNFGTGEGARFDADSFVLMTESGVQIPVFPVISEDGHSFTIGNVPALAAGGSYTLTYRVNVLKKGVSTNTDATVKNLVTVSNEENVHTDEKTITYRDVLVKKFYQYENHNQRIRWTITVRPGGMNLKGFVLTDVADSKILETINRNAADAAGNYMSVTLPQVVRSDDNPNTFSLIFPDVEGVYTWTISYYTEAKPEMGKTLTSTNTATIISTKDEVWTSTATGTATGVGTTTVSKSGSSIEKTSDDTATLHWSGSVSYDGVVHETYMIEDYLGNAEVRNWRSATENNPNSWAYWDSNINPRAHYGIAAEIYAKMQSNMIITILNEQGNEENLTFAQLRERVENGVFINFYTDTTMNQIVSPNDDTTRVRYFRIFINGVTVKNVSFAYDTHFDLSHYSANARWRMRNRLKAEGVDGYSDYLEYSEIIGETGTISKQVSVGNGSNVFTGNSYTFDYDKMKGRLTYRLLVTPTEGSDSLTVTDVLPEGLTLINDTVRVGNYSRDTGLLSNNWTNNENVSITYPDAGNNTLRVTVQNLGTELQLKDQNIVVIQYTVQIDERFERSEGAVITNNGTDYSAGITYTNMATHEDSDASSSLDVTVNRTIKVLSKAGEQITSAGGANTNRVHYAVTVNPGALDLIPNSEELILTDTVVSTALDFDLDVTSVRLYTADADGNRLAEAEPMEIYIKPPVTEGDTRTQTFTIHVKDSTSYILEYDYIADKREDLLAATSGELVNTISLTGYASDETTTEVKGINVRASSHHAGLLVVKVDEKNNAKRLSAEFKLEIYENGAFREIERVNLAERGYDFDYYSESCRLEGNRLYRLVETDAPDGYKLDETPFYFIIRGNIQDVRSNTIEMTDLVIASEEDAKTAAGAPEGLEIHMLLPEEESYFEITNEKLPASTSILLKAMKTLIGRNLADGEFHFTVTEDGKTVAGGSNAADGTITFSEIIYTLQDVGRHIYTITEDAGSESEIVYDSGSFEVIVTVEDIGDGTLRVYAEYPENGVVFTNKYTQPTVTPTPTVPKTPTVTPTPTVPETPSVTPTPTVPETPSVTPTPTVPETPTVTPTPAVPETPSVTPTPTVPETPTVTPTPTVTETPSVTPTPTVTSTPAATPTPTVPADRTTSPKTGDDTNGALWICLLLLSAFGIICVFAGKQKRKLR